LWHIRHSNTDGSVGNRIGCFPLSDTAGAAGAEGAGFAARRNSHFQIDIAL
jgi:hypothetical protein